MTYKKKTLFIILGFRGLDINVLVNEFTYELYEL